MKRGALRQQLMSSGIEMPDPGGDFYETKNVTRYPVLYLPPGAGEDERGWTRHGRANFILDNLIAASRANPMTAVATLEMLEGK
jgi:hypothetical protein